MRGDTRGRVELVDALMSFFVLVAVIALAPQFYRFTGMAASSADPFSSLLLQLVMPTIIIALMLSIGVSAVRGR